MMKDESERICRKYQFRLREPFAKVLKKVGDDPLMDTEVQVAARYAVAAFEKMDEAQSKISARDVWDMAIDIFTNMGPDAIESCFQLGKDTSYEDVKKIDFDVVVDLYTAWIEAGRPINNHDFKAGDIIRNDNSGEYEMLFAKNDNSDGSAGWDTITSEGNSWISSELIVPIDMHLDLETVPINGVIRFLKKLEKNHENRH